jgi:hypothetical protein
VLRGLDYLRSAGVTPNERTVEAIDLVASKRGGDRRWLLETGYPGVMPIETDEGEGRPSRWNTLHALRVLRWYERANCKRDEVPTTASGAPHPLREPYIVTAKSLAPHWRYRGRIGHATPR